MNPLALTAPAVVHRTAPEIDAPATARPASLRLTVRARDYAAMTKPRILMLVSLMAAFGFVMAAPDALQRAGWTALLHAMLGTALAGAGANVLNQVWERRYDALMERTRTRPLPAGRLLPCEALTLGLVLSFGAVAYLFAVSTALVAALTAVTVASYVLVYTPLKRVSYWSVLVGAVPGALPPLIGWSAAARPLDRLAWSLFAIMFVWQLPHFLAIAWRYRADYARAGYPMLPVIDPDGHRTARQIVAWSVVLLVVSLFPGLLRLSGGVYLVSATLLGLVFLFFGLRVARYRTDAASQRHLLASLAYLPAVFIALLVDRMCL